MLKNKNPLAFRNHPRTPVEFPSARFSTFSIRWIESQFVEPEAQATAPGNQLPVPAPSVTNWDFRYVYEMFTASMDWGSVNNLAVAPVLDFGSITTV
jgi:hypothetical protein